MSDSSTAYACSACRGTGESHFIACGADGCHNGVEACRTCSGTGHVSQQRAEQLAAGRRDHDARVARKETLRDAATRLSITAVQLSQWEVLGIPYNEVRSEHP